MSEQEIAILMANKALDVPNADPDDDLRTISRQFLRSLESLNFKLEQEKRRTEEAFKERDMWHSSFRELSKSHVELSNKLRKYEELR